MSTAPITPIETILQNRAKLAKLPPEQQQRFADFIFRKFIQPKMDSANVPPEYAARAKKQFTDKLLKGSFQRLDDSPTTSDRELGGQATGIKGKLAEGASRGVGNIAVAASKLTGIPGMGGDESKNALLSSAGQWKDSANASQTGTEEYEKAHPIKAGAAEMVGQSAPAIPFGMATGGAMGAVGVGASSLPSMAATGAVDMQSFDPGLKGVVEGTVGAGLIKGGGKLLSKVAAPVIKSLNEAATKRAATKTTSGLGSEAVQALDRHAQTEFQKPFVELTSEQKPQVLKKFREEAIAKETAARTEKVKAVQTSKIAEREAKEQAKVHSAKAAADAKLTARVERDRLRDEAKVITQAVAKFRKLVKRTPTEEELGKIREAVKSGQSNAASAVEAEEPKVQAAAASQAGEVKAAEAVPLEKPPVDISSQLEGDAKAAYQKGQAEAMAKFKAENPEAIKAAEAFTSFAKDPTTGITKVPEGVHGSGFGANEAALNRVDQVIDKPLAAQKLEAVRENPVAEGLKGKNADRKAVERATAAAQSVLAKTSVGAADEGIAGIEKVAASAATPEDKLIALDKAIEYLDSNLDNGRLLAKSIKMAAKLKKWSTDETLENTLEIISRLKKEGKLK